MKFKTQMPKAKPESGSAFIVVSVKDAHGNRVEIDGRYPDSIIKEVWDVIKGKDLPRASTDTKEK